MAKRIQKIIVLVNPPEKMPKSFQAPRMRLTGLGWFLMLNGLIIVLYSSRCLRHRLDQKVPFVAV